MAFRYRIVILIHILALPLALLLDGRLVHNSTFEAFLNAELIFGTGTSLLWLLICWVATGSRSASTRS